VKLYGGGPQTPPAEVRHLQQRMIYDMLRWNKQPHEKAESIVARKLEELKSEAEVWAFLGAKYKSIGISTSFSSQALYDTDTFALGVDVQRKTVAAAKVSGILAKENAENEHPAVRQVKDLKDQLQKLQLAKDGADLAARAVKAELKAPSVNQIKCGTFMDCLGFLGGLDIAPGFLDHRHNKCYCPVCYPPSCPDTIDQAGGQYIVPRGWCRIALHVNPGKAQAHDVFQQWPVSFHGVKSPLVLKSVLEHGDFAIPGDTLIDGSVLKSTKCAGRQDEVYYTSPTIRYAGLRFYAEPQPYTCLAGTHRHGQIVLQCRQNPKGVMKQKETMGFKRKWPQHVICRHVNETEVECLSQSRGSATPYGVLLRTFPTSEHPEGDLKQPNDPSGGGFCSPVDRN
jgi:hypothetical protein